MAVQCLSHSEKCEILDLYEVGVTRSRIAHQFAVSTRTVGRVIEEMRAFDCVDEQYQDEFENNFLDDDTDYSEDLKEDFSYTYFFVASEDAITITKLDNGKMVGSIGADQDHPSFEKASSVIWENKGSQESLEQAYNILDKKASLEQFSNGVLTVKPEENVVVYMENTHVEGEISGRLCNRLIEVLSNEGPDSSTFQGLVQFTSNLMLNPSNRAVNELYTFLEASCIDIDIDGNVICFKKVQNDYKDIHSSTFDNSPGSIVEIPRNKVDEDSNNTCSYGLHVCSSSYLPYFGSMTYNRVVKVSVKPMDFVAIPSDYQFAKARVCRYAVLEDVTSQFIV